MEELIYPINIIVYVIYGIFYLFGIILVYFAFTEGTKTNKEKYYELLKKYKKGVKQ